VAFADRILLNKIDLVSPEQLQDVVDTIRSINAVAEVIQTTNSSARAYTRSLLSST
jgi:G3E family GTPase